MINWDHLAQVRGYQDDRDLLESLYTKDKLSMSLMSQLLGVSKVSIRLKLKDLDIPIRPRGGANRTGSSKSRLDEVPESDWESLSLGQLSSKYKMHPSSIRKYAFKKKIPLLTKEF
jgi:DeoR/GlpR family transcriptional regulator of sugar metabolism